MLRSSRTVSPRGLSPAQRAERAGASLRDTRGHKGGGYTMATAFTCRTSLLFQEEGARGRQLRPIFRRGDQVR